MTGENNNWATRDPETGRHHRNAHLIELGECDWRCLICGHTFAAASDADLFACGNDCTGKHPGDAHEQCGPWMSCHAEPPMLGVYVEVNTDPPKPPYGSPEREAFDSGSGYPTQAPA